MTPKELRNLKRLIKSGDEKNIELAKSIDESYSREIIGCIESINAYVYNRAMMNYHLSECCMKTCKNLYEKYSIYYLKYLEIRGKTELILNGYYPAF